MDSDEILRYIYEYGYTTEHIACTMSTDINLGALNVTDLATLGYNLHALEHKSNCLKYSAFSSMIRGSFLLEPLVSSLALHSGSAHTDMKERP